MYWSPAFFAYWELATKHKSDYVVAKKVGDVGGEKGKESMA